MSNIFLPISISNLHEIVPKGEDILYSSLSKIREVLPRGSFEWRSPILITASGIALMTPTKKKGKLFYLFTKWRFINEQSDLEYLIQFNFDRIYIPYDGWRYGLYIVVIRDKVHESKESFKDRADKFAEFCENLWFKKRKELGLIPPPIEKEVDVSRSDIKKANQIKKQAIKLLNMDYSEAGQNFYRLTTYADDDKIEEYFNKEKNLGRALELIKEVIRLNPNDYVALCIRAEIVLQLKELKELESNK